MGARQSKRSVDITTSPKKGDAEAAVTGAAGEGGEGKLEKIPDPDLKITTNGTALHNEIEFADKDENSKDETEETEKAEKTEVKENGVPEEPTNEPVEKTNAEEQTNGEQEKNQETESKTDAKVEEESKKKKEKKKKWSFRSISFSKKDKSKPEKIKDEKNEDVKEVAEENPEAKTLESPKTEEPSPKTEEVAPKSETESSTVIPEESPASVEATEKDTNTSQESTKEESKSAVEEPVAQSEQAKVEESAPASVAEEPKAEEPKAIEEPKVNGDTTPEKEAPADEPTKEVRTEEVPPPLPSSNPPSSVTVFAESTTADSALLSPSGQVTLDDSVVEVEKAESPEVVSSECEAEVVPPPDLISESQSIIVTEEESCPLPVKEVSSVDESCPLPNESNSEATQEPDSPRQESTSIVEQSNSCPVQDIMPSKDMPSPVEESFNLSEYVLPTPPSELELEPTKSESVLNEPLEESTKTDIPPSEPHTNDINIAPSTPPPTPAASTEKAPVDLPSIVSSDLAAADSLPDISTESLPSLPEPVSESLPEPMSLPPVDSVPEPIAPSESNPVENHPPLTNGTTNGLNGTTNGLHSPNDDELVVPDIPSGPAKQVLSEAVKECEITNNSAEKPSEVSQTVAVEE